MWRLHIFQAIWLAVSSRSLNCHGSSYTLFVQPFCWLAADFGSWKFLSHIFCTLMINMLLSIHSKNMVYFSRFSNFLWLFPWAKALGNMFQRKLEKLEKYLPYFFFDLIITYMYLNGFSSARGCQALELLMLVYLISVPIDFRPTDREGRSTTNFPTLGFDLSLLRYTSTPQQ